MIAVADVEASSLFYQRLLGAASGHGGSEYERLLVDGVLVLQLHQIGLAEHHGRLAESGQPIGNGVALWFEVDEFDGVLSRARGLDAQITADVHLNPNARQREFWIRDLDGYRVVFSEARG